MAKPRSGGKRIRERAQVKRPNEDRYLVLEPSAEVVILNAAGLIPEGSHILDLGCGRGDDCVYLAGAGCICVGVDNSRAKVAYAASVAAAYADTAEGSAKFLQLDVRTLGTDFAPARRFDFVLDRLTCSNLSESDQGRLLRTTASLLSDNGVYCLVYGDEETEHAPDGHREPFPDEVGRGALGRLFREFRVEGCRGLPKVFGGKVSARPVLASTFPAKVSNAAVGRLLLLQRRDSAL